MEFSSLPTSLVTPKASFISSPSRVPPSRVHRGIHLLTVACIDEGVVLRDRKVERHRKWHEEQDRILRSKKKTILTQEFRARADLSTSALIFLKAVELKKRLEEPRAALEDTK